MNSREVRPKFLLVDTNILLLYIVGQSDRGLIARFKRTSKYNAEDFLHLQEVMRPFAEAGGVVTTPHVLAELSNLASQLAEPGRSQVFRVLAAIVPEMQERHLPALDFHQSPEFIQIGIADTAILQLADTNYLILTDDYRLAGKLEARGIAALNFNQFRLRRILNEH